MTHPTWIIIAKFFIGVCGILTLVYDLIGVYGVIIGELKPTWEVVLFLISQFVAGAVTIWTIRK